MDDTQDPGTVRVLAGHQQRGAAGLRDAVGERLRVRGDAAAPFPHPGDDRSARALADLAAVHVHTRHPGLGGERHPRGVGELALVTLAQAVLLLGENHHGPALGRLVGQRGELGGVGQFGLRHTRDGEERGCLPVAEGDGAGLVEQQRRDITRRLDGTPGHGEHIALHEPVHAGDADRREQRADGGRDQADQQRGQHDHGLLAAGVDREGLEGDDGEQEDDGEGRQEDVQGDLVGRLLPGRALDQSDHPVDEGLAGLGGDLDDDAVGEHLRTAGDGAAVTAGLPDDRGRFAGDRGLVDAGDALDDISVPRNDVAGLADDQIADAQVGSGDPFLCRPGQPAGDGVGLGLAQGVGLGLAAALGDGLRQVGEDRREPQPDGDRPAEPVRRVQNGEHGGEHRTDQHHEHHRGFDHGPGVELAYRVGEGGDQHPGVEQPGADAPFGSGPGLGVLVRRAGRRDCGHRVLLLRTDGHDASPSASGPRARAGK